MESMFEHCTDRVKMDRLRDYMEERMKFTLQNPSDFDLLLTDDFCSGLLSGESILHADTVEAFRGVPVYPLYKRLALSLLKSIDSGSFCGTFEKIPLVKEVIWLKEREAEWDKLIIHKGSELINMASKQLKQARCFEAEYNRLQQRGSLVMINKCLMFEVLEVHKFPSFYELLKAESPEKVFPGVETVEEGMQMFIKFYDVDQEKINGVVAIHLTKSVVQPCVALSHILSGLSYTGVQSLLGLSHTIGSIFHALPPPRSALHSSFMLPYRPKTIKIVQYMTVQRNSDVEGIRVRYGAQGRGLILD